MEPISWSDLSYWGREREYVLDAVDSTWLSGGRYVERFEALLEEKFGLDRAFSVSNGTAALQLAYTALGIEPGDEVVVPAFGFMAVANVLKLMHAVPVFAEVNPDDWCLDVDSVASRITPRTKAIACIHTWGVVARPDELRSLADKHGLYLIEDCAESALSTFRNQGCGSFGHIGTFSFHATKTITTGEGGMVSCADEEINDRIRLIRSHGLRRTKHYWHEYYGNNYRLSNVLAAIGVGQLERSDRIIEAKKAVFGRFVDNLSANPRVKFQQVPEECDPVMWAVGVQLDLEGLGLSRDDLMDCMTADGIECRPGFYTPNQLPIYAAQMPEQFAVANSLGQDILVLPSYSGLTEGQIDRISDTLTRHLQS